MKIAKQWLQDFVDISKVSSEELMEVLTMHTVEVEEIINQAKNLEHVVVGKVTKVEKHPDADRLNVCEVSVGRSTVPVVCGGSNVREGMLCSLGKVGAKVKWHGEGDVIELKKTKIRGVASEGMICAAEEIGLGDIFKKKDEKEILDLSDIIDAKPGTPLAEALGLDSDVLDVDNKSMTHRPDLWGHYGLAREVAAIYQKDLKAYEPKPVEAGSDATVTVDVQDNKLCPRYMGVMITGIDVATSPMWLQQKLMSVGLNPINNIVDITNLLMLELGQPLHAFDANEIGSDKEAHIIVRHAKKGETMVALGGEEYELDDSMLVIANKKEAIAIAGVKGGEHSGITNDTKTIVLEAANFDAVSVRRTSTAIGLRTDASARYEKSLDPNMAEVAMNRAVELILELCPNATVTSNVADSVDFSLNQGPIELSLNYLETRIGTRIEDVFVTEVLGRLGFGVEKKDNDLLSITVPTWRTTKDINEAIDLVEEVARMYGYHNIPPTLPQASIAPAKKDPVMALRRQVREILAGEAGYTEVYNYSYVSPEWLEKMGLDTKQHIELDNPIAKDRPFIRRSLLPNMLQNMEANLHRFGAVKIFEVGLTYLAEKKGESESPASKAHLPLQETQLGLMYASKDVDVPFFEAAAAIRQLVSRIGQQVAIVNAKADHAMVHPGRFATIEVNGTEVGNIAELHPQTAKALGIDARVAMVQLNLETMLSVMEEVSAYERLSQYPAVSRDVAMLVNKSVNDAEVRAAIQKQSELIESVALFDVYEGNHVADKQKSMAYRIVYRSKERTLTSEEVDAAQAKVEATLVKTFDANIR